MENWQKWKLQWLRRPLQEQFEISVIVAKGLPKDRLHIIGHKNILHFYAFYKQATRGPCQVEKPKIIDVSKRAKWEAWKKLGNMTKNEAMFCYVEHFKKVFTQIHQNVSYLRP